MPAENIKCAGRRLLRNPHKFHVYFFHLASALAVIAVGTGSYDICPDMLTTHMTGRHVIDGQVALALSAVLAGIIVPAKDLTASQFDMWTRPMNLVLQPDD